MKAKETKTSQSYSSSHQLSINIKQQHQHEPFGPAGRNPGPDPTAARPRRPAEAGGGVFPLQGPARPQPRVAGHRLLAARWPTRVEKVFGPCRTRHQGQKLMEL